MAGYKGYFLLCTFPARRGGGEGTTKKGERELHILAQFFFLYIISFLDQAQNKIEPLEARTVPAVPILYSYRFPYRDPLSQVADFLTNFIILIIPFQHPP